MKPYCLIAVTLVVMSTCYNEVLAGSKNNSPEIRFSKLATGVIKDIQTDLMWSTKDNGADITWYDAEKYCESFNGGGFDDWRLPRQKELETLYDLQEKNDSGFYIINQIRLTGCCPWASDDSLNSAGIFSFKSGKRPWGFKGDSNQLRVLPVRGGKPHLR